ncbi:MULTISPECIES: ribbon-helix-helix protein, CopG family [Bifidobacterium]|nr:CopG family transcriptional regulator [Bifidobacterium asteroides]MBI0100242.1 CopG family transcriptional regulator [Bifidobacterium sp. W8114]
MPKDLDDKASRLAKQEGTNKSAIIRKAVAWYLQNTDKQPTTA